MIFVAELLMLPLMLLSSADAKKKYKCVDGVDNVIRLHDIYAGVGDVSFEDAVLLTYDSKKRPSCVGAERARFRFPGFFKFSSGRVHVLKPQKITGSLVMAWSLRKNSFMIGDVCEDGRSVNAFVDDQTCFMDVLPLTGAEMWRQFETPGTYEITHLPGNLSQMQPINAVDNQYVEGEWSVSIRIKIGSVPIAGFSVGKPGDWLDVVNTENHEEL